MPTMDPARAGPAQSQADLRLSEGKYGGHRNKNLGQRVQWSPRDPARPFHPASWSGGDTQ